MKGRLRGDDKKETQKLNIIETSITFRENNGQSNRSQSIIERKKSINQKKNLRRLISEIDVHGYVNESKRIPT